MPTGERRRQAGYTYLLVLFAVAALGLVAAEAGVVWQTTARREREAELLAIGVEMARALARYRDESPLGARPWPSTLEELVEDRRFPVPRRHLRRIYRDPFTGRAEWGLVREGEALGTAVGLAHRWERALEDFAAGRVLPEYLGAGFCRVFVAIRRFEAEQFHARVPNLDYEWYLPSI